jgi:hypothetical protein
MASRAAFAPGEAREDWAILRALSDVLGKKLPYDSLTALRAALYAEYPHFAGNRHDRPVTQRDCRNCEESGPDEQIGVCVSGQRLLFDQPDRTRICGDGRVLGLGEDRQGGRRNKGGKHHGRFHHNLCLARGHHSGADAAGAGGSAGDHRLHPLRRPQDLGCRAVAPRPERGRPVGSVPVVCRPAEVRLQGTGDSRAPTRACSCSRRWWR